MAELSPVIQRLLSQQQSLPFPQQTLRSWILAMRLVQMDQRQLPVKPWRLQRNQREKGRQQITFILLNYVQRFK